MHEEEIRMWVHLEDEEGGLYFLNFSEKLRLAEVIAGARCPLSKNAIVQALGPLANHVAVIRAREDYSSFQMAEEEKFE